MTHVGHNSAVRGTFADFKTVKTRGVCQLIIEVPIEAADHALTVLGGVPQAKAEQWVGIAPVKAPDAPQKPTAETEAPKLKGGPLSKRAGMLCNEPAFQRWIMDRLPVTSLGHTGTSPNEVAADLVRDLCNVQSRAELDHKPKAARIFEQIEREFYDSQQGRTDTALMEQRR